MPRKALGIYGLIVTGDKVDIIFAIVDNISGLKNDFTKHLKQDISILLSNNSFALCFLIMFSANVSV